LKGGGRQGIIWDNGKGKGGKPTKKAEKVELRKIGLRDFLQVFEKG